MAISRGGYRAAIEPGAGTPPAFSMLSKEER
jgi:hypothetical protein